MTSEVEKAVLALVAFKRAEAAHCEFDKVLVALEDDIGYWRGWLAREDIEFGEYPVNSESP